MAQLGFAGVAGFPGLPLAMPMPGADALQIPQPGASGAGRVRAVGGK